MSIASFIPPSSGEAAAIFSLIQVLSNPKEAEATLKKMVEAQKKIDASNEEYKKLVAENAKNLQEAKDILSQVDQSRTSLERDRVNLLSMQKDTESGRQNLAQQEDAYTARIAQLNLEIHAFAQEKANNDTREKRLASKEATLAKQEKELMESVDKHRAWLESIKPPRV